MKKRRLVVCAVGAASLMLGTLACKRGPKPPPAGPEPEARPSDWYGDSTTRTINLDQGWTSEQIEWFYTTTQGSELMPYDFFIALEQADSEKLLREPRNMQKFRYLVDFESPENPDDLPIGFARNEDKVGMTCAACHTTQINYEGTGIRIEGGPAMADFDSFMNALIASIKATLDDEAKFDRFAERQPDFTPAQKPALREQLEELHASMVFANEVNMKGVAPYGFARLDAFGRIYNRALTLVDKSNGNPANAPVSYPFLWDTSQHDYVQWPGNAPNANLGELQRNIGEVIGVFGSIEIDTSKIDLHGYSSSVDVKDLNALAKQLRLLVSPLWPASVLPPLDTALVARGAEIFEKECARCHLPIDRTDPERVVRAQMYGLDIIKTDPTMANNAVFYSGKTGVLEGRKSLVVAGDEFGPEATAFEILTNLVAGILENNIKGGLEAEIMALKNREGGKPPARQGDYPKDPENPSKSFLAYKSRPLNGIWATAPFLHNGSVPTLYDLLLPAAERPKTFYVGRREFDPKKVGFVTEAFEGGFEFDTSVKGNSNAGHEYGAELDDDERWALVEYMKSL